MALVTEDLAWYEEASERVLGLVALDLTDRDYVSYVLGRDARGRFRAVWLEVSIETQQAATELLEKKLAELWAQSPPEAFHQGDEVGRPVDFFAPVVAAERQHRVFATLISARGYSPARALIGEMMHYFVDVDGNFIQQFQSDGFDARIWELYLYAVLNELGYGLDRANAAPDFHCQGLLGDFFIEATTVNPSGSAPEVDDSNRQAYFENYVPMKYGSTLFTKLGRKYWEQPHVAGHPFALAIQDFHAPHAMAWSNSALVEYLYGIRQVERVNGEGKTEIVSERVTEYRWCDKPPIPAGFFLLPDSENVSAVLANPSGTLPKFNHAWASWRDSATAISRCCGAVIAISGSLAAEKFYAEVHAPDYAGDMVQKGCRSITTLMRGFRCRPSHFRAPRTTPAAMAASSAISRNSIRWGSTTHIIVPT